MQRLDIRRTGTVPMYEVGGGLGAVAVFALVAAVVYWRVNAKREEQVSFLVERTKAKNAEREMRFTDPHDPSLRVFTI